MPAKTKSTAKSKSKPVKRAAKAAKPAKRAAKPVKPAKRAAKAAKPAKRVANRPKPKNPTASRWVTLVAKHGVVLASAHGPVPTLTDAIAGEPIVGSWWAHPKGKIIFAALSELDDCSDILCFKLIDHKVTYVHRRLWPALVCLARAGALAADQVAAIRQEHMPTGDHRMVMTPLTEWADSAVRAGADALTADAARAQLGAWTSAS